MKALALALVFAAIGVLSRVATLADAPNDLQQHPCTFAKSLAYCGTLRVPESRTPPRGRTILLHFVRIPALHGSAAPIFPIAGGPGQSIISAGDDPQDPSAFGIFKALHSTHDFVLLDQRGTGLSHPLNCELYAHGSDVFAQIFPTGAVTSCREVLARTSDLSDYGTDAAADDLDALRARLGYHKIILVGGSYGTMLSLVYLRRHGDTVQSELLEGVAPPFFKLPLPMIQGAQKALDDLVRSCAGDAFCSVHFPRFLADFNRVVSESERGIPIDYAVPHRHQHVHAVMSHAVLTNATRLLMYAPESAVYLPLLYHEAALGNTTPLARAVAAISFAINGSQAIGDNIGVDCQEGVAFISDNEARSQTHGTFMGMDLINARRETCKIWQVMPAESTFIDPVKSDVPVLMMSGLDDPATPYQYGMREVAYLSHGRQVLIPNGGHNNDNPCLTNIELRFLQTSSAKGLDASCAGHFKRPAFGTALPDWLQ